jgi:hypothetical protein
MDHLRGTVAARRSVRLPATSTDIEAIVMHAQLVRMVALVAAVVVSACSDDQPISPTAATPIPVAVPAPVPSGIRMQGTVGDTAFRHLAGARVEVLDGAHAGMSTTSDSRGQFTFIGDFDDNTRFQASMDGFVTSVTKLLPFCDRCNPNRWAHFYLEGVVPPVAVNGSYTMTLTMDGPCGGFPLQFRERSYTAIIPPQTGPFFDIAFGVAPTVSGYIQGGVAGNYVGFWMEPFVEQLSPNSYLLYSMSAAATVSESSPSTIEAIGDGGASHCVLKAESGPWHDCFSNATATTAACNSRNHRLTFARK